jgi:protoheme IX farnesyltransferase
MFYMPFADEGASLSRAARESSMAGALAGIGDYLALTKPRVMSLAVFTAVVGQLAAQRHLDPASGFAALLFIAIGAGAAGALNMWYDADVDVVMSRTAGRPIPSGRVSPRAALIFGLMTAAVSVIGLALFANAAAASLLAFTIFFYVVIYTMWLKRWTPQSIVIGGAAGAAPPAIGWIAASGQAGLEPVILFLIIFLWTPPHFWASSLNRAGDYVRAGIPALPVVSGEAETHRQIVTGFPPALAAWFRRRVVRIDRSRTRRHHDRARIAIGLKLAKATEGRESIVRVFHLLPGLSIRRPADRKTRLNVELKPTACSRDAESATRHRVPICGSSQ